MLTRLSISNISKLLQTSVRNMASSTPYTFQEIKAATTRETALVIDVREAAELKETGVIPGSVNIPVGSIEKYFKDFEDDQFKEFVGKDKPRENTEIVLSCLSGRRSEIARKMLEQYGYYNVHNYKGGWLDWEENISKEKRNK